MNNFKELLEFLDLGVLEIKQGELDKLDAMNTKILDYFNSTTEIKLDEVIQCKSRMDLIVEILRTSHADLENQIRETSRTLQYHQKYLEADIRK
jgi:hypothetical protein